MHMDYVILGYVYDNPKRETKSPEPYIGTILKYSLRIFEIIGEMSKNQIEEFYMIW